MSSRMMQRLQKKLRRNESVSNCANVLSSLSDTIEGDCKIAVTATNRIFLAQVGIFINVSSSQDVTLHMQMRENISIVSSNWCYFGRKCNSFLVYLVCRFGKLFMPVILIRNKKT